jgi:phosphohistidine swiveling domain-containing protein
MESTLAWEPPGPGPWQQDSAHNPVAQTLLMQQVYPAGFNRGFEETFAAFGVLLDRLAMGTVNGFTYHQPQPFDLPGPDGPKDPEWIGAEFGRRVGVAAKALDDRIWRDAMRRWDDEIKPAAIARHRELDVDVSALTDAELSAHVEACAEHVSQMVYQHHRFNGHALVPVGDFVLNAARWTGQPMAALLSVFDGYSPASNVVAPEMQPALVALRQHVEAREALFSNGEAGSVIAHVRQLVPEVGDYVDAVHFRVLEGFDICNPTIGERPACLVGRLQRALEVDMGDALRRSDAAASEIRALVTEADRAAFDDLLGEARLVYRLRDERGLYSDISAIGLIRLALLELGRRLEHAGRVKEPDDLLEADLDEIRAMFAGADEPSAHELHERGIDRLNRTLAGAPRHLGPPAPPPPPVDMLPPPMARVMSSIGFIIEGVLGEMEQPAGDDRVVVGIPASQGSYEGNVRLVRSVDDLFDLEQGDVLVAPTTGEAFNSMLHLVGAIVTNHGSFASHAAIVSREMGIPAVVGTIDGTRRLAAATRVLVDGTNGTVTILE